jgi:hypothetical protein
MGKYVGLVMAVVVGAGAVAGCSGGDNSAQLPPPTTATAAATPSPTPTPTLTPTPTPTPTPGQFPSTVAPTGPLRVTKGMTRPGTRLRFGEKAIVPIRYYNSFVGTHSEGVISIVVQRIQHTAGSKVEGNFDAKSLALLKNHTAYYAKITITNESGNDLSSIVVSEFNGYRRGGREPDGQLIGGELEACPEEYAESFDHKGASYATCEIAISSRSRPVREIHYSGPPYGVEHQLFDDPPPRFNDYYDLGDIVWR